MTLWLQLSHLNRFSVCQRKLLWTLWLQKFIYLCIYLFAENGSFMRVKLPYEFGFSSVEELMKFLAVVHFREVGYLVAYHIVAQVVGEKHEHIAQ